MIRGACAAVFVFLLAVSAAAQSADMSVTKSGPATATPGSTITYQVTISNLGPQNATNAKFVDTLPSGVTFSSILQTSGPTFTCTTGGTVTCSIATLTAGTTATFNIDVTVQPSAAGTTIINGVTASSDVADPNNSNNQYFVGTDVSAGNQADLSIGKSGPASAAPNTDITYTITVSNLGPNDANGGGFSDNLPAGTTFVSVSQANGPTLTCSTPAAGANGNVTCTAATFPVGVSATVDVVVHIDPSTPGGTVITNTATAVSQTPDPNGENNSSSVATTISGGNVADVAIVKNGPAASPADTDVTYTITLTNDGPGAAANVSWIDTLPNSIPPSSPLTFVSFNQNSGPAFSCSPGATTTCSIATFPAGSTATFTLVAHIPAGTTSGHTYTNVVNVTSDDDPNPDNDTSSTTVTVSSADVGVTKSGPATAIAGGPTYDYIVTLSNGGPDAATDVSFSDQLPAGLTFVSVVQNTGPAASCNGGQLVACTISLLGNGQSAQFTITVQPQATIPNGAVLTNTATASTSSADTNPNNDSSSVNTTVNANADVAITKSGPATNVAGNAMPYTITVTNNGPAPAANVSWSDTLPAGVTQAITTQNTGPAFNCTSGLTTTSCSIASLASGATATFTINSQVSASVPNGTVVSNTASVTSTSPDPASSNNSSTVNTTITTSADVQVVKFLGPGAAAIAGSDFDYEIIVNNPGLSDAQSVTWTDILPAGTTFVSLSQTNGPTFACTTGPTVTCTIGTLHSPATFLLRVHVSGTIANGTPLTNTANVTSTTFDPNLTNNTSTASTLVSANADLSVTKTGPATTPSNTPVVYTVTARNGGQSSGVNVSLSETVPNGMTFVSVNQTSGPPFSCSGTGPIVCTIATLDAGISATFQFTFNVPQGTAPGTVSTDTVTITSSTPDSNPSNNTATATTTVGQNIPALSPLAMALLAMALAMIGWMAARR